MLRVQDLLREFEMRILAGEVGLDARVQGVQSSDLLDPTPWLVSGELLLTTGSQLEEDLIQRDFIARLAEHDVVGLGLASGRLTTGRSPEAIVAAAEEHRLPLFEVPESVPFIAISRAAITLASGLDESALHRAMASQETLERSVSYAPGLESLVDTLSTLLGAPVLLFDDHGVQLVASGLAPSPGTSRVLTMVRGEIRSRRAVPDARALRISAVGESVVGFAFPILAEPGAERGATEPSVAAAAWLVALKDSGALSDVDRILLRQAVPIGALHLLRRRISEESGRREASDLLASVISGELSGPELAQRLEARGLTDTVAAIVVERAKEGGPPAGRVQAGLTAALEREAAPALVADTGTLICALVAGLPNDELFDLATRLRVGVTAKVGHPVSVGAGRAVRLEDARRSFDEARLALEARALAVGGADTETAGLGGPADRVATFRDLGSYQLLLSLHGHESLQLFCDSIIGPIEAMESAYGGELLKSLQVFIEANGQWERAARQLFCHRHTLRYRIRKIEELTGRDLESADDRIEFYLALRARRLLS